MGIFKKKRNRETQLNQNLKDKMPKKTFISRFDWLNRFNHWFLGKASLTRSIFRVKAAWQGILIIASILMILWVLSAFYTGPGEFVISLDRHMSSNGFYLSNTPDFEEGMICIRGTAVVSADNISIFDIRDDVMEIDGEHNGNNYVAHTFYLTNRTGKTADYRYSLQIRQATKNADKAIWIMICKNGKQQIYAKLGANGEPEAQYSAYNFPFSDYAESPEQQYLKVSSDEDSKGTEDIFNASSVKEVNKLVTIPFASDKMICSRTREAIANNEVDKYTVVIWYEGEDPECVDDIIGGWVELYMNFTY